MRIDLVDSDGKPAGPLFPFPIPGVVTTPDAAVTGPEMRLWAPTVPLETPVSRTWASRLVQIGGAFAGKCVKFDEPDFTFLQPANPILRVPATHVADLAVTPVVRA